MLKNNKVFKMLRKPPPITTTSIFVPQRSIQIDINGISSDKSKKSNF
jgi:hypothetical protein